EAVTFQVLAVNTGTEDWLKGTYYWEAEIYDLEYRYLIRTDPVTPEEDVPPGSVASAFLKFQVPETYLGRRFYRVFLVRNGARLIESDYRTFLISERPIKPPPPVEKYKIGGNVTLAYKNSGKNKWKNHSGASTTNMVGKVRDSSFLLNTYFLHESGKLVEPFIFLFNYYAPWGIVSLGDISPTLSPLSVYGQGMRGAMLEQEKGRYHWILVGGQTVASSVGTLTTNGRYQRLLFGAKAEAEFFDSLKIYADYILGTDEAGSLSTDPKSPKFRGPTLTPQKNPMTGLGLSWNPLDGLIFLGDFQRSTFFTDASSSKAGVGDTAWRGEIRWEKKLVKTKAWAQRTGPNFKSFGAPTAIPDRMTLDGNLNLYPLEWWSLLASVNQYKDNLANASSKVTTTQRIMTTGNSFLIPTGTTLNLTYSLNTAQGEPKTAQDNQTTTLSANITQSFKGQSLGLGLQTSQFSDKNKRAHDLDSQTITLNTTWSLFHRLSTALGTSQSTTKDKVDSSQRKSQAYSVSLGYSVLPQRLAAQLWGTTSSTKNDSPTLRANLKTTTLNTEWTYNTSPQSTVTLGAGHNQTVDTIKPANDVVELTATLRYSYSF
ncbi:MAG: hypothetical protein HY400_05960, partial [Elusimicrobia bacterium]|nr:hypothetical protein [Elusimicrobiota bacterium]